MKRALILALVLPLAGCEWMADLASSTGGSSYRVRPSYERTYVPPRYENRSLHEIERDMGYTGSSDRLRPCPGNWVRNGGPGDTTCRDPNACIIGKTCPGDMK